MAADADGGGGGAAGGGGAEEYADCSRQDILHAYCQHFRALPARQRAALAKSAIALGDDALAPYVFTLLTHSVSAYDRCGAQSLLPI